MRSQRAPNAARRPSISVSDLDRLTEGPYGLQDALVPVARWSGYVEGTVVDRQPGLFNGLLRKPIPGGTLSLFEVHDRNAISVRGVIGKANPLFHVSPFPLGEACDPDP